MMLEGLDRAHDVSVIQGLEDVDLIPKLVNKLLGLEPIEVNRFEGIVRLVLMEGGRGGGPVARHRRRFRAAGTGLAESAGEGRRGRRRAGQGCGKGGHRGLDLVDRSIGGRCRGLAGQGKGGGAPATGPPVTALGSREAGSQYSRHHRNVEQWLQHPRSARHVMSPGRSADPLGLLPHPRNGSHGAEAQELDRLVVIVGVAVLPLPHHVLPEVEMGGGGFRREGRQRRESRREVGGKRWRGRGGGEGIAVVERVFAGVADDLEVGGPLAEWAEHLCVSHYVLLLGSDAREGTTALGLNVSEMRLWRRPLTQDCNQPSSKA